MLRSHLLVWKKRVWLQNLKQFSTKTFLPVPFIRQLFIQHKAVLLQDRLDDKLQLYVSQYGELDLENHSGNTEEVKINDLKARIRMEEDQAGMLSRRIMELQTENENLIALLNNNVRMCYEIQKFQVK